MNTVPAGSPRPAPVPPTLGPQGIDDAVITYVLRAGAQAPSFYNTQPWRLVADGNQIDLYLDDRADTSLYDWHNLNSLLACGAALENMLIAAQGRGLSTDITEYPDPSQPLLLARLTLARPAQSGAAPGWGHPLEEAIWRRHTNTLMFADGPATPAAVQTLQDAIGGFPQTELHLATTPEQRQRVFTAASTAEQVRFARQDLHEQLHRMIRWSDQDAVADPTGYTLPSMGACGIGETFFRVTRRWSVMRLMNRFGANRDQAKRACLGLLHCAASGLLTIDGAAETGWLAGGRALERLWLAATQQGLDLQPHSAITVFDWIWRHGDHALFSETQQATLVKAFRAYQDAFPDAGLDNPDIRGIFLFRVGFGEPVRGYTLRRAPR